MVEVKNSTLTFLLAVALFTVLATPTPTQAQFVDECRKRVSQLTQETAGSSRLAVWTNEGWQFFVPNDSASPHSLGISGHQHLCLAWEAPPYPRNNAQIVYASTQYRADQPLWLYRKSWGDGIPGIRKLLGHWKRTPGPSGVEPDSAFKTFHSNRSVDHSVAPWKDLYDWHVWTWFWRPNRTSYHFVSAAVNDLTRLPFGSERLLRLVANRRLASWAPFTTRAPSETLRVAVSYTGDDEPFVYQYEFAAQ